MTAENNSRQQRRFPARTAARPIILALALSATILIPARGGEVPFRLPPAERFVLSNGARVIAVEDELPLFRLVVTFDGGKLAETGNTAGIGELVARTLTLAGSTGYPGDSLHEAVEAMGGTIAISSGWEDFTISVSVLDRYRDRAVAIVQDLVANPRFAEEGFALAKKLVIESLRRRDDSPDTIAFETTREIIFGGTGYGAIPTIPGVEGFTLENCRDFWSSTVGGAGMVIGISSPAVGLIRGSGTLDGLGALSPGTRRRSEGNRGEDIRRVADSRGKIYLYEKNIPQSTIVTGTVAPGIGYAGVAPLAVMNYILGGGSFNSRLMNQIRVRRGLAYSTGSVVRHRQSTGLFLAYVQTRFESTGTALGLMRDEIQSLASTPVTGDELNWAQESIHNSYIFNFDTVSDVLSHYISLERYGLPDTYAADYLAAIGKVNGAAVLGESRDLVGTGLVTVVVGRPELAAMLASFGEVVKVPAGAGASGE